MGVKTALITGTSTGIGLSLANILLERGWEVIGLSRRAAPLEHDAYHHIGLDLADLEAVEAYFTGVFPAEHDLSGAERIALINNAGLVEPVGPTADLEMEALRRAYAVNTIAPVWLTGYFLRATGNAPLRIVNVSSGAAYKPHAGWSAYCGTKAALLMAGKAFEQDLEVYGDGGRDVALLNYSPGVVDTPMQELIRGKDSGDFPGVSRFQGLHERGELVKPEDTSRFLADMLEAEGRPVFEEYRFGGGQPFKH